MDAPGVTETAWLFTRGPQSVRMFRLTDDVGGMHLVVHGPGAGALVHHTDDLVESMLYQASLGRDLFARGFQLHEPTSDRRRAGDRRHEPRDVPDRRRAPTELLESA